MRTLLRRAILAAVPAVTLPMALLIAPGTALAGPAPMTISVTHQATLVAGGGAAVVTVISRCAPDPNGGYLVVYLLQGPNYDSTAVAISCDGARHTLQVDVPAGPVSGWMAGKAVATVSLCGTVACTSAFTTVKIT